MVFQDPNASLNPRMSVRQVLDEPLRCISTCRARRGRRGSRELVEMVGLDRRASRPLSARAERRPAPARRHRPGDGGVADIVILDEPTSSLDVSVRGQILDLLLDLQQRLNLAYLFITTTCRSCSTSPTVSR